MNDCIKSLVQTSLKCGIFKYLIEEKVLNNFVYHYNIHQPITTHFYTLYQNGVVLNTFSIYSLQKKYIFILQMAAAVQNLYPISFYSFLLIPTLLSSYYRIAQSLCYSCSIFITTANVYLMSKLLPPPYHSTAPLSLHSSTLSSQQHLRISSGVADKYILLIQVSYACASCLHTYYNVWISIFINSLNIELP